MECNICGYPRGSVHVCGPTPSPTKDILKDAAKFANFCQKLKSLMWDEGFSGEDKMDKIALEMWKWLKPSFESAKQQAFKEANSGINPPLEKKIKKLLDHAKLEGRRGAMEEIRKWAKEHNQCSDLVSTFDLMRYLSQEEEPQYLKLRKKDIRGKHKVNIKIKDLLKEEEE